MYFSGTQLFSNPWTFAKKGSMPFVVQTQRKFHKFKYQKSLSPVKFSQTKEVIANKLPAFSYMGKFFADGRRDKCDCSLFFLHS